MRQSKATSDELVTIARFSDSFSAELARNDLQAAGIKAFLIDQSFASNVWYLTTAVGGIRLQVLASDAKRAAQVFSSESHAHRVLADDDRMADEHHPNDGAISNEEPDEEIDDSTPREKDARRAFRSSILSLLFPLLGVYTVWLLLKVAFSNERLSRQMRNQTLWAAALSLPVLAVLFLLFKWW